MSQTVTFLALLLVLFSSTAISKKQRGQPAAAVPCNQVVNELTPCLPYLHQQVPSPSTYCCQGAQYVYKHYGKGKKKRQGVCQCLESVLPLIGQVDGSLISALPQKCGVKLRLPSITPSFNCSQIK